MVGSKGVDIMKKVVSLLIILCISLFSGCDYSVLPDAPEGVAGIDCSKQGAADGQITGVNSSMEYKPEGSESYIEITTDIITGLKAGKYYVRYKKTDSNFMSEDTEILISEPAVQNGGPVVKGVNCTYNGADDGKIQNVDNTMEYSADGGNSYLQITSNEITGLSPNTYFVRYKSPQSQATKVIIMQPANPPAEPVDVSRTKTSITLQNVDGCEYSINGNSWQASTNFTNLKPGREYTFYQRVKATDTTLASSPSSASISTLEKYNMEYITPSYSNDSSDYLVYMTGETEINVRRGPGTSYYAETAVSVGDSYTASAYKSVKGTKWVYFPTLNGWISSRCLIKLKYSSYSGYVVDVDSDSYLILRDSPSYSSKELDQIPYDEYGLPIYNTSGQFYLTYYNGQYGWISKKFIELERY